MEDGKSGKTEGRPRVADIARLAGTSQSTVSKVLNGYGSVSAETRRRVEEALSSMKYAKTPSRHMHSRNIALVLDDTTQLWSSYAVGGGATFATGKGVNLVVVSRRDLKGRENKDYVQALRRAAPLGVVVVSSEVPEAERKLCLELGVRLVLIDPAGNVSGDLLEVRGDNWAGGLAVGRHLAGLGHRRVGLLSGPDSMMCFKARMDGCAAGLLEAGIVVDDCLVGQGDSWSESARLQALDWLNCDNPPTAVFAGCDTQAAGVFEAAHQLGVRVPEELSVVGFDDVYYAQHLSVPLTTVRMPYEDMVERAFILALAGEGEKTKSVLVEPELVIRSSTAAACR